MKAHRPLETITPTMDGPVLEVLAREEWAITVAEVHARLSDFSLEGVRRVLARLTFQGTVVRSGTSRRYVYCLNREHVAAAAIVHLAGLREELLGRIHREI